MARAERIGVAPLGATLVGLGLVTLACHAFAEQTCDTSVYALSSPSTRFEDHGDGTVTDKESNLMWMRCSIGQTWAAGRCTGTASALTWSQANESAGALNASGRFFFKDWRLPKLPELASITERQCKEPRINLQIFPDTPAAAYWSATTRQSETVEPLAFTLSFGPEGVSYTAKTEQHDVRLVHTAP
jgi:hypothetical protein